MMPMTSEQTEQERTERTNEIRQFMLSVFSLQEKVAQVAQMAMTLSAQAANLAGGEVQGVSPIDVPAPRIARGTQTTTPMNGVNGHAQEVPAPVASVPVASVPAASVPTPSVPAQVANPGPKRRRPRATTEPAAVPKGTVSSGAPSTPKSSIEIALARKPMTPAQLARATSQSVQTTNEILQGLTEQGKVFNISADDHPIWTYRPGDGIGDNVTNDELQEMIIVLLTSRWLPIRTLVAATGVRTPRVDGILTKLKRAGLLEVRKEGETGRALIYTMREKPDPKHPYLKSNKPPKVPTKRAKT